MASPIRPQIVQPLATPQDMFVSPVTALDLRRSQKQQELGAVIQKALEVGTGIASERTDARNKRISKIYADIARKQEAGEKYEDILAYYTKTGVGRNKLRAWEASKVKAGEIDFIDSNFGQRAYSDTLEALRRPKLLQAVEDAMPDIVAGALDRYGQDMKGQDLKDAIVNDLQNAALSSLPDLLKGLDDHAMSKLSAYAVEVYEGAAVKIKNTVEEEAKNEILQGSAQTVIDLAMDWVSAYDSGPLDQADAMEIANENWQSFQEEFKAIFAETRRLGIDDRYVNEMVNRALKGSITAIESLGNASIEETLKSDLMEFLKSARDPASNRNITLLGGNSVTSIINKLEDDLEPEGMASMAQKRQEAEEVVINSPEYGRYSTMTTTQVANLPDNEYNEWLGSLDPSVRHTIASQLKSRQERNDTLDKRRLPSEMVTDLRSMLGQNVDRGYQMEIASRYDLLTVDTELLPNQLRGQGMEPQEASEISGLVHGLRAQAEQLAAQWPDYQRAILEEFDMELSEEGGVLAPGVKGRTFQMETGSQALANDPSFEMPGTGKMGTAKEYWQAMARMGKEREAMAEIQERLPELMQEAGAIGTLRRRLDVDAASQIKAAEDIVKARKNVSGPRDIPSQIMPSTFVYFGLADTRRERIQGLAKGDATAESLGVSESDFKDGQESMKTIVYNSVVNQALRRSMFGKDLAIDKSVIENIMDDLNVKKGRPVLSNSLRSGVTFDQIISDTENFPGLVKDGDKYVFRPTALGPVALRYTGDPLPQDVFEETFVSPQLRGTGLPLSNLRANVQASLDRMLDPVGSNFLTASGEKTSEKMNVTKFLVQADSPSGSPVIKHVRELTDMYLVSITNGEFDLSKAEGDDRGELLASQAFEMAISTAKDQVTSTKRPSIPRGVGY